MRYVLPEFQYSRVFSKNTDLKRAYLERNPEASKQVDIDLVLNQKANPIIEMPESKRITNAELKILNSFYVLMHEISNSRNKNNALFGVQKKTKTLLVDGAIPVPTRYTALAWWCITGLRATTEAIEILLPHLIPVSDNLVRASSVAAGHGLSNRSAAHARKDSKSPIFYGHAGIMRLAKKGPLFFDALHDAKAPFFTRYSNATAQPKHRVPLLAMQYHGPQLTNFDGYNSGKAYLNAGIRAFALTYNVYFRFDDFAVATRWARAFLEVLFALGNKPIERLFDDGPIALETLLIPVHKEYTNLKGLFKMKQIKPLPGFDIV